MIRIIWFLFLFLFPTPRHHPPFPQVRQAPLRSLAAAAVRAQRPATAAPGGSRDILGFAGPTMPSLVWCAVASRFGLDWGDWLGGAGKGR